MGESGDAGEDEMYQYSMSRVDIKSLREETVYNAKEHYKSALLSPYGTFLLAKTADDKALLIDVLGGTEVLLDCEIGETLGVSAKWAPDESAFVFSDTNDNGKGIAGIYDVNREELQDIPYGDYAFYNNWSGNSKWLAVTDGVSLFYSSVYIVSRDDGDIIRIRKGGVLGAAAAAVNYDGSRLAYAGGMSLSLDGMGGIDDGRNTIVYISDIKRKEEQ